jgi:hypothetical protein
MLENVMILFENNLFIFDYNKLNKNYDSFHILSDIRALNS